MLLILSSVFPFLYVMLEAGTDLGFKCDNIVKIIISIRKEGEQCPCEKELKSRSKTDILQILREKTFL